jgi:hypothetical protein
MASGVNQVSRDINSQYINSESGRGRGGRSITAPEIQTLDPCSKSALGNKSDTAHPLF